MAAEPPGAARLLPLFDQYVVSSNRGVEALLPQAHRDAVFRQAGWISPVILVDGAIAGVWKHERKGAALTVELSPFAPLPDWAAEQLRAEADRLAGFLGGSPCLPWRPERERRHSSFQLFPPGHVEPDGCGGHTVKGAGR